MQIKNPVIMSIKSIGRPLMVFRLILIINIVLSLLCCLLYTSYCTKSGNSRASFRYPPYPILWIGLRRIALLAVTQFTFASFTGSPPSWNVSGKKYGKNLPSVYFTFLISLNRRRVAPFPTLPTTCLLYTSRCV